MFSIEIVLVILMLLSVKHFIFDFHLQKSYQYRNKGTYGHPGGLLHGALHIAGSFLVIAPLLSQAHWMLWFWLCVAEGVFHYHVDWAKMNINKLYNWQSNTSEEFWILTGFDQLLHYLTYFVMVYAFIKLA